MNRNRRKQLVRDIENSVHNGGSLAALTRFVQQRPWTFAEICYTPGEDSLVWIDGYGFSKVNWPDEWSPGYGRWLAIRRAAYDIVERLEAQEKMDKVVDLAVLVAQSPIDDDEIVVGEDWVGPSDMQMDKFLSQPGALQST